MKYSFNRASLHLVSESFLRQNYQPVLSDECRSVYIQTITLLSAETPALNKMDKTFPFIEPMLEVAAKPVIKQMVRRANDDSN